MGFGFCIGSSKAFTMNSLSIVTANERLMVIINQFD